MLDSPLKIEKWKARKRRNVEKDVQMYFFSNTLTNSILFFLFFSHHSLRGFCFYISNVNISFKITS